MAKRRKGEIDTPVEDPLGLLDPDREPAPDATRPVPIPTGLSDEDDAHRFLNLKFNDPVMCWNCETVYEREVGMYCPRCAVLLRSIEDAKRLANRKKLSGA